MLQVGFIRENQEKVIKALAKRNIDAKREADKKHRATVENMAIIKLAGMSFRDNEGPDIQLGRQVATEIIEAIASGRVPNVKVVY